MRKPLSFPRLSKAPAEVVFLQHCILLWFCNCSFFLLVTYISLSTLAWTNADFSLFFTPTGISPLIYCLLTVISSHQWAFLGPEDNAEQASGEKAGTNYNKAKHSSWSSENLGALTYACGVVCLYKCRNVQLCSLLSSLVSVESAWLLHAHSSFQAI